MATDYTNLQELLDKQFEWPAEYLFKFIAPQDKKALLEALLATPDVKFRESKNGKYVSVTARVKMQDSSAVIEVYRQAEAIEGVLVI